jgi:hypothetical protein
MADAEEAARIPRLEIEDKMRQRVLRHQERQAQLQAQARVVLAQEAERLKIVRRFEEVGVQEAENLKIVRMFEELGYVRNPEKLKQNQKTKSFTQDHSLKDHLLTHKDHLLKIMSLINKPTYQH